MIDGVGGIKLWMAPMKRLSSCFQRRERSRNEQMFEESNSGCGIWDMAVVTRVTERFAYCPLSMRWGKNPRCGLTRFERNWIAVKESVLSVGHSSGSEGMTKERERHMNPEDLERARDPDGWTSRISNLSTPMTAQPQTLCNSTSAWCQYNEIWWVLVLQLMSIVR